MKELEYPFDADYLLKKKKMIRKELLNTDGPFINIKVAILGGSTTNDIRLLLELFLLNHGLRPSFYESEYNRYYEDLYFDNPELDEFNPDIIYIHTSNRNIKECPNVVDKKETIDEKLNNEYTKFESIWEKATQKYHCGIIQNNFELPYYRLLGNQDASDIHGFTNFITKLNQKFYDYANNHDNFFIHDILTESSLYGLEKWSDPYYWTMYKYSLCVPAIPYTAFGVANIIKSIYGKNKKALALDFDNTIWDGVIGDIGADNIGIGMETAVSETYTEFQKYIKQLKSIGIILTAASKNDEDIAITGLQRPDSILKPDDFTALEINWERKDQNIIKMAKQLNLLPESFVFVDDNPAERNLVREAISGISVPELQSPEYYIQALDRSGVFEMTKLSSDDLKRNQMYMENKKREEEKSIYKNYKDYLLALNMKAEIRGFVPEYMSRIAQLTNKSNQFNLTTKRYTLSEIEEAANADNIITLYGKLEDKFGDNGVVSIVIGERIKDELHIRLWLMSCRVLKRDMEFAMMDKLIRICIEQNIKTVYGYYYPTAKNKMVKDFYKEMGFTKQNEDLSGNTVWTYKVEQKYENKNKVICVD